MSNQYTRSNLERFETMQERFEQLARQLKENRRHNVSVRSSSQELMKEIHQLLEQFKSDTAASERGETYNDSHSHN
jgi:intein/homing endonuclease